MIPACSVFILSNRHSVRVKAPLGLSGFQKSGLPDSVIPFSESCLGSVKSPRFVFVGLLARRGEAQLLGRRLKQRGSKEQSVARLYRVSSVRFPFITGKLGETTSQKAGWESRKVIERCPDSPKWLDSHGGPSWAK